MTDAVIVGLTGEYRWTRRPVWFWEVKSYEAKKWRKDTTSGKIRPVMIWKERRPNE